MYTPEQADNILRNAGLEDETKWKMAVNTILLDLVKEHSLTRRGVASLKPVKEFVDGLKAHLTAVQAAAQNSAAAVSVPMHVPTPQGAPAVVGGATDGGPLGPEQAQVEAHADEIFGPRGGSGPVAASHAVGGNGNGGRAPAAPSVAGPPGSNEEQAQVEAQADEIFGPRQ